MAPPEEWRMTCRGSLAVEVVTQVRRGDRSWWVEYVELIEEGFVQCSGTDSERREARAQSCSCGAVMSVRTFELIGDEGELVARRTYALCVMCSEWAEF
jgi:hypothetical protein